MDELEKILEVLKAMKHEVSEVEPGVYMHTFTPPEMTMEDLARLLMQLPDEHTKT